MSQPRLKLRVSAAAERALRSGHPWVYSDSVREVSRAGALGELAVVYDRQNRFLAAGLYDPESPLRLRALVSGAPQTIDDAWWQKHLAQSLARREGLFDDQTTGYRWISGENDGWPGLVLDRYGPNLVLKLYTAAWLPRLDAITTLLCQRLAPECLVLRLSRNLQTLAKNQFGRTDGEVLSGKPPIGNPVFLETGLRFEADILRGQKTGFFLDQRENRRRVETLGAGRAVLNAFSFSGGFSLYAARGGARAVTDLDISAHALESAQRNFALNQNHPAIAACACHQVQADAFVFLSQGRPDFDLVVLDPPSLARREPERATAIQAYGKLVAGGIRRLRPNGILVAASCSAHVSATEFFSAVRQAVQPSRRTAEELAITAHPPDHPATIPEAHYLKCIFLRLH
jgi:23S rRNA (cytosine1962-C5)-methyltransferase